MNRANRTKLPYVMQEAFEGRLSMIIEMRTYKTKLGTRRAVP